MSSKHLAKGSLEPRQKEGFLRLYSMVFCPYAQRARLVLNAKQIPHDIVNINVTSKPDWYLKIHPEGKVPVLLDGDKVVIESLDICDYLDEKFPDIPCLYPVEPASKEKDKEIIRKIGPATAAFHKCFVGGDEKTPEEWIKPFIASLQPLEDELLARGTTLFGGDKPMIDYMLWPWGEREESIAMRFGIKLSMEDMTSYLNCGNGEGQC